METDFLPPHLHKYIVEQNYDKYTSIDHAVWRYILRQLRNYLGKHAHDCYLEGLKKTGISVERIPRIEEINEKLVHFGWRALPVSGFIPPAAFMELQSLGILPIASDMRSLEHLLYTPAPDIVHEAAGHAPILIHPEFSHYLQEYAQVAKKAIISKEDLDLYEAIRNLSDIKENPASTELEIQQAEENLNQVIKASTHVSEATELSRMNWWTAEYGLIGDVENPKIFGAGLLSSVGEAKLCLSTKVKKIPLTVDCIKTTYDITEPQPQLFVAKDFKHLSSVLHEMAEQMAFKTGGIEGLNKALQSETVNTAELNSGVQISGKLIEVILNEKQQPSYLRFEGPSQLSFADKELQGHSKEYHSHGFGTPLGLLKNQTKCISDFSKSELDALNLKAGQTVDLDFASGVHIQGTVKSILNISGKNIILSLENASAKYQDRVLFAPEWGTYDVALGTTVTSVFGGPADRVAYGELMDFVATRVPAMKYSAEQIQLQKLYADVRALRENTSQTVKEASLEMLYNTQQQIAGNEWLVLLEMYELSLVHFPNSELSKKIKSSLLALSESQDQQRSMINDGLVLAGNI